VFNLFVSHEQEISIAIVNYISYGQEQHTKQMNVSFQNSYKAHGIATPGDKPHFSNGPKLLNYMKLQLL